jgi:YfiR/HmsC-like
MDVPLMPTHRTRRGRLGIGSIVLAAALTAAPGFAAESATGVAPEIAVKAAFLYNFAKFAEWPALLSGAPIIVCILGDDGIAAAFVETVRGQNIGGHTLNVWQPQGSATWRVCNLLFIAAAETRRSANGLDGIRTLPVLTVSDGKGFSETSGIIELYVEDGRLRFAINVDAAERSGLHLSSRLLGLARIVRNDHVQ